MPITEQRAPLHERLNHLAQMFYERAYSDGMPGTDGQFLRDHASSLAEFACQVEEEYVRINTDDEWPTNAQGIALARFLRPLGRGDRRQAYASIAKGGMGLGWDYLSVRLSDGYEGGIAPDGRVST